MQILSKKHTILRHWITDEGEWKKETECRNTGLDSHAVYFAHLYIVFTVLSGLSKYSLTMASFALTHIEKQCQYKYYCSIKLL